jgi:S-adenosylmethionine hydrolase
MPIITLTTDFGLTDGYVAAMKGVIAGIAPQATVIDITHQIAPQNVRDAAYVLASVLPYFPPGAVHLAVVDPGVGSARRPIAAAVGDQFLVGPDNGLFTCVWQSGQPAACIALDNPAYWRPQVSHTFHGRDIFAPVAAHLANGVALAALGTAIADPLLFDVLAPQRRLDGSLAGQIIHVDHFGNLVSNIPGDWLAGRGWAVHIAGRQLLGPSLSYAAAAPGQLLALVSSGATLEIALRDGSAASRLRVAVGEPIVAHPHETGSSA